MAWPTLSETFTYLQINEAGLSPDELQIYTQERDVVIASIEDYTERKFERLTSVENKIITNHQTVLKVDQYPINDVISLSLNGESYDEFKIDNERGLLYLSGSDNLSIYAKSSRRFWPCGEYEINYDHGFDDIPTLLLSVYYDLFLYRYNYRQSQASKIDLSQIKRASVAGVATVEFNTSSSAFNQQWVEYLASHQDVLNKFISERGLSFDN